METELAWKVTIDEIRGSGYNLDIDNPSVVPDDYGDPHEVLDRLVATEAIAQDLRDRLKTVLEEALLR